MLDYASRLVEHCLQDRSGEGIGERCFLGRAWAAIQATLASSWGPFNVFHACHPRNATGNLCEKSLGSENDARSVGGTITGRFMKILHQWLGLFIYFPEFVVSVK